MLVPHVRTGRETLFEEDCSEEEVEVELAPLTVQLAYVLGRLGRVAEAQELYEKVSEDGIRIGIAAKHKKGWWQFASLTFMQLWFAQCGLFI